MEMTESFNEMKNSGFDYNLPVIKILVKQLPQLMLLILNWMFFFGCVSKQSGKG